MLAALFLLGATVVVIGYFDFESERRAARRALKKRIADGPICWQCGFGWFSAEGRLECDCWVHAMSDTPVQKRRSKR